MFPFAFFQTIGPMEFMIIGMVALLIFGNRLPGVARSLGRSFTEFKKGVSGIESEIDDAVNAPPEKKTPTTPTP